MDFVDDDDSDLEYEPDFEVDEDKWIDGTVSLGSLDITLSRIAHQVESKLTLQLNVRQFSPGPFRVNHLLPKFLGYGGLVEIKSGGESTPTVSLRA